MNIYCSVILRAAVDFMAVHFKELWLRELNSIGFIDASFNLEQYMNILVRLCKEFICSVTFFSFFFFLCIVDVCDRNGF